MIPLIIFIVMADYAFLKIRGMPAFGFERTTLQNAVSFPSVLKLLNF